MTRAYVEKTTSGRFRWRIHDPRDGELASSGKIAYERVADCRRGLDRYRRKIANAVVVVRHLSVEARRAGRR